MNTGFKYNCVECMYFTNHKGSYEKHLDTSKHLSNIRKIEKLEKKILKSENCFQKNMNHLNRLINQLEKKNKKLNKENTSCRNKIVILEKKIEVLETLNSNGNTVINNTVNNNTNSHNTNTITNNYNINILPYSDTDYSILTKQDIIEAMAKKDYYLSHLFKKLHIDNPNNRNLFVRTKKAKEIYMYRGEENGWEPCDADKVLYGITMRCENACDDALEKNGLMEKYDPIINKYVDRREEDDKYQKKIYQKFQDVLYMYKDKMTP